MPTTPLTGRPKSCASPAQLAQSLYRDECGAILSAELVIIGTILILGLIVGLAQFRHALIGEFQDLSLAFSGLNQSYGFTGFRGCPKIWGRTSFTCGSSFYDVRDINSVIQTDNCEIARGRDVVVERTPTVVTPAPTVVTPAPAPAPVPVPVPAPAPCPVVPAAPTTVVPAPCVPAVPVPCVPLTPFPAVEVPCSPVPATTLPTPVLTAPGAPAAPTPAPLPELAPAAPTPAPSQDPAGPALEVPAGPVPQASPSV